MNFVQQIYNFNSQAGLLDKPYDDFLESSFQIEEALEGFDTRVLATALFGSDYFNSDFSPKTLSRTIVRLASGNGYCSESIISDVDRLDKAIDAIVFGLGSIFKLKLTPEQASRAISIVCEANLQKLSMPKDEHGKLTKPSDFVGPEVKLQEILDERI